MTSPSKPLSPTQSTILQMIAQGDTLKRIANRLGMSEGAARHHRNMVYAKLGARNAAHAVAIAMQGRV